MPKPLTGLSEQHKEKKRSQVDSERKESSESLSHLFYLSLEVGREKVNMSVGFSNETKHFFFFLSHSEGSVPHSDFKDGNNLRTPAL